MPLRTPGAPALLESILGAPNEALFDPKFGGLLYIGAARQKDGSLQPERSSLRNAHIWRVLKQDWAPPSAT